MRVTPLALALAAVSFLTAPLVLKAQPTPAYQPTPSGATNALVRDHFKQTPRASAGTTVLFDPALAPFFHGVASGDPLTDRVILWTRVTQAATGPVTVSWTIGTSFDAEVRQVTDAVNSGIVTTGPERDYTVKVDADGLAPGTTYYYQFQQAGARSIVGRTRTAPEGAVGRLRFGVAADANYQSGFFNAYEGLAARADLDAVIHLGDYIHERRPNTTTPFRPGVQPETETVTLADYRLRHGFYKLDPDARAMHQQHPLIAAWDDHESADNAYAGGAANHNEPITFDDDGNPITFAEEGDWEERKAAARRAYFEWMPLREPAPDRLYRRLAYGDLAELFMLDTRLAARDEQVPVTLDLATQSIVVDTTTWLDPDRVLLGAEQQTWLTTNLEASTAQWKVIGNQVMMVPMAPNPSWEAVGEQTGLPAFTNLDAWDGYPFERAALLRALRDGDIENVVVLSGDIHSSWAADVPLNPYATSTFAPYVGAPPYNPFTGANSVAVEFVTPSVASVPFAQTLINALLEQGETQEEAEELVETAVFLIQTFYPQVKALEPSSHGYVVLDLSATQAQADWFYTPIDTDTRSETFGQSFAARAGTPRLRPAVGPAPDKPNPPALAPVGAPVAADDDALPGTETLLVLGVYPNPTTDRAAVGYVLRRVTNVTVRVFDVLGREVAVLHDGPQAGGVHTLDLDTARLSSGTYLVRVEAERERATRTFTVGR